MKEWTRLPEEDRMFFVQFHKNKGDSLAEYALILGIVSLALIGMNIYIKRGVQGRIKQMSDKFISSEQLVEMDPTTVANSLTTITTPENKVERRLLGGGAIQTGASDNTTISITRHTVTQADPSTASQEVVPGRAIIKPKYLDDDGGSYTPMPPMGPGSPTWVPPSFSYTPFSSSSGDSR